jgi:hypothetical protein
MVDWDVSEQGKDAREMREDEGGDVSEKAVGIALASAKQQAVVGGHPIIVNDEARV